jgi:CrcB-like protein
LKYDILLVFLGGGFGAVIRELLVMLIPSESLLSLPVFIANMTASFFVGILAGLISKSKITGSQSAFLSVGLMGGLSTFSTFIYEIVLQIKTIDAVLIVYVFLTLAIGLMFVMAGLKIGSYKSRSVL